METQELTNLIEALGEIEDFDYCCDCVSDISFSDYSDNVAQLDILNRKRENYPFTKLQETSKDSFYTVQGSNFPRQKS